MPSPLDLAEVNSQLAQIEGWTLADQGRFAGRAIVKSWRFANFSNAFAFMTRVALLAEKLDHHPDWTNSYGRVEIYLTSHDAGGVTKGDLEMAILINELA